MEHGGNLKEISRRKQVNYKELVDFSANINPLGTPTELKNIIKNNLDSVSVYPDYTYDGLKEVFSKYFKCNKEQIIVGNGAIDIFESLARALPKEAILITPTFSEYRKILQKSNADIKEYKLEEKEQFRFSTNDFLTWFDGIKFSNLRAHGDYNKSVYFCNPNNPTGNYVTLDNILVIAKELLKRKTYFIVDESFIDFICPIEEQFLYKYLDKFPNLIIIRSLTKFYAIPGIRLGIGLFSSEKLKEQVEYYQMSWTVNIFADLCGQKIPELNAFRRETIYYLVEERDRLLNELNRYDNITVYQSKANFIFFFIETENFYSDMLDQNIVVRNCENFNGLKNGYYRICVGTRENNNQFIKGLKNKYGKHRK